MQFEYYVEKVRAGGIHTKNLDDVDSTALNNLGKDGWRLVSVVPIARETGIVEFAYFYFIRESKEI